MPTGFPDRRPFKLAELQVGWVDRTFARTLLGLGCQECENAIVLPEPDDLAEVARCAAEQGHFRWRDELFDVREIFDGPVLSQIDRGAIPAFGMLAEGVHLNGLVTKRGKLHLWVARRSQSKLMDPGKLDHLVAGGIGAGSTPYQTLLKEAGEEAGMPEALASQAAYRRTIAYDLERQEGLRRDRLHCYDLMLPEDFQPEARDGEVEAFELWPIRRAIEAVRDTARFKFNVRLVLEDLFKRLAMV